MLDTCGYCFSCQQPPGRGGPLPGGGDWVVPYMKPVLSGPEKLRWAVAPAPLALHMCIVCVLMINTVNTELAWSPLGCSRFPQGCLPGGQR